jgi:hypothetical protein
VCFSSPKYSIASSRPGIRTQTLELVLEEAADQAGREAYFDEVGHHPEESAE